MASLIKDTKGNFRILFYSPEGPRKTVRLGKVKDTFAAEVKGKVESLLDCKVTGQSPDKNLIGWLQNAVPWILEKLTAVDLIEIEDAPPKPSEKDITLDAFLDQFLDRNRPGKKPATLIVWGQVFNMLREYMPKGILLRDVTVGHAKAFAQKLKDRKVKTADGKIRKLAPSTIAKRVGFATQFFQDALDWELIERNPFRKVKPKASTRTNNVEVPIETVQHILKHCDTTWSVIVALSRFGGLRCPSETLSLTWGHIDWENSRMNVPEPKVEHHEGRGIRAVPLFPDLRKYLEAAFEDAHIGNVPPPRESFVVDKPAYRAAAMREGGWANANLRTQFLKILERAGVTPWARLFHSMRASRQTELERLFPRHVVCAWLGNSEDVAKRNYLLVTESDFSTAANAPELTKNAALNAALSGPKVALNAALQGPRNEHARNEKTPENTGENDCFSVLSGVPLMEDNGLELRTRPPTKCGVFVGVPAGVALNAALLEGDELFQAMARCWDLIDKAELRLIIDRVDTNAQAAGNLPE